ncbi:MAG TPA: ABC transporter permease [Planctomycetota bacterium]|jgi:ABC-type transport system involved in multi-copper enzyme maturation permease subunit|nr:ABC transporter permease [Planctomycetota bacterium]
MKRVVARALLQDAFSQVMDNKVFRLLVLASITLIAPAFLIGFREDGIHILFGWKLITYQELFATVGARVPHVKDLNVEVIQGLQTAIVQGLAGGLGIMFCIAATAFFVPRMLEKGAADTLFTKPLSRVVLLLSRYIAGLIFVGVLSFLLVLGIHLGLLLVSGYSDPAFLWCTLTLVYVYALVQTVSLAVGVFTRSSVAAILTTVIFFAFNGCVHSFWIGKEWNTERNSVERENDADEPPSPVETGVPVLKLLGATLDALHYTLPKTSDADVLTKKLRTVLAGHSNVLTDEAGKLAIDRDPEGFVLEGPGGNVDLLQTPATWISRVPDGSESARMTLSRRSRLVERPGTAGSPPRISHQSTGQAASECLKSLVGRPEIVNAGKEHQQSMRVSHDVVRWSETDSGGTLERERAFFAVDDWIYELDVRARAGADARPEPSSGSGMSDRRADRIDQFMRGVRVTKDEAAYSDPGAWYAARLGWTSPVKFNAFFSIGSSLAFAALMLGIATWRLSRIDF